MANGVITGKEVFSNVVEEAKKVDEQLKNVLGSYKAIIAELQNFKTANQGNDALKKRIELDEKAIAVEKKLIQVEKERANALTAKIRSEKEAQNAIAASERAKKAHIQTQSAQITLDKRLAASGKRLNSFYKQQSVLLNELRDKYKSLNLRKAQGQKLSKAEAAALIQLEARVRSLDAALKKADAAAGQFNRNVGNYPKGLRLAAGALRSFIGAFGFTSGIFLFASAIKNALNRVREFDKSMQNLAGILRTNRSALADVEKEIIKVAGSSIKTSREVANLAEALATLGLRGEALKDLIKPANDLAIGLETSSAEAAEFLVQNLNAFGESSDKAAEYADTIATIRTSTSLDFQRMRDSFQYLLPISRILGRDLAYTGGIIGLLNDNAIKAEQGARLLGTAQQKLAKDGLSLNDAMLTLNKAVEEGKSGQEQLAIASDLVGKQAAKVIVTLANNADAIEEYAQKIRDGGGALEDLVNEQLKSLDAQTKILDSTWEELILTIENGNGSIGRTYGNWLKGTTAVLQQLIQLEKAQANVFRLTGREESFFEQYSKFARSIFNISSEYDRLVDKQKEFNLQNENSDGVGIGILKSRYEELNIELENNNNLSLQERQIRTEQQRILGEQILLRNSERKELETIALKYGFAEKELQFYGSTMGQYTNGELQDFIDKNRVAIASIDDLNESLGGGPETIDKLQEELSGLRELYESAAVGSEKFSFYEKEVIRVQNRLNEILKRTKKSRKEQDDAVKGSIGALEKLIAEEKKAQKNTITTSEELVKSQARVNGYKKEIAELSQELILFNEIQKLVGEKVKVQFNGTGGETFSQRDKGGLFDPNESTTRSPDFEKAFEGFKIDEDTKITFDLEIPEGDFEKMQQALTKMGETASQTAKNMRDEIEKTGEFYRGIFQNVFSAAQDLYGVDLQSFVQLLDKKETAQLTSEEKIQAYAQASQQTLLSLSDALLSGTINRLNQEEDANRAKLQTVLDDESATQDEKDEAQKRYDAENLKIRQKQFKAEQDSAIANAIINGAVAVLQAYAQLGPVGGTIAAALIAGLTAFQITNIKKQKPPQFFKGKKATDNFEGWGTVGEKGKEVIISGDGTTEVTPGSTTPRFIKKDDIIIPSISQYDREMKDPTSDTFKRVNQKLISDTNFRTNMVVVHNNNDFGNLEERIEGAIQKGFKRANIVINQKPEKTRRTRFAI